ncbi:hypothetical protein TUBRATIS_006810 [Tubulinosema ratisbonensis]|uniref:Uncharacterized protein n=1 Tax=Tubulinosema ratisbonensis TaxID=291195 RepID=A0A437AP10_9MICR|nr:hypothetical protein TUBRATIS_006810 [Tubulinosema ratisbonensis]
MVTKLLKIIGMHIIIIFIGKITLSNTGQNEIFIQNQNATNPVLNSIIMPLRLNNLNSFSNLYSPLFVNPDYYILPLNYKYMLHYNNNLRGMHHTYNYLPYQSLLSHLTQQILAYNEMVANQEPPNYYLGLPIYRIPNIYSQNNFVTYQTILETIKTPEFNAINNQLIFDANLNNSLYKSKIQIIKNQNIFRFRLNFLIRKSMKNNKKSKNVNKALNLMKLIIREFEYDYKHVGLFTIFILFLTRGFKKYTSVDKHTLCGNLLARYKRNRPFSDRAIINTIKIWKSLGLRFDTIKEGYDILMNLGKYFIINPKWKNIKILVCCYKRLTLSSLKRLF